MPRKEAPTPCTSNSELGSNNEPPGLKTNAFLAAVPLTPRSSSLIRPDDLHKKEEKVSGKLGVEESSPLNTLG